jgi:hypothetical protein
VTDERFARDRFTIKQRIRPMVNLYEVSADGQALAFARQKRMALREDIRVFADESEQQELFRIKARAVMDITARNDVTAADGTRLGSLTKAFGASLLRSTWRVLDPDDQELFAATEKSTTVALLRRVADFIPFADMVPIPYHFTFVSGGRELGGLTRVYGLRDQYELDLSGDTERRVDRRLAIALGIALDALQAR